MWMSYKYEKSVLRTLVNDLNILDYCSKVIAKKILWKI